MPNQFLASRLSGLQRMLIGLHEANASMSSASKGSEREQFIGEFLTKVLSPIYRFGTGDATDSLGNKSGQLDVVIEHPFSPTLPIVGQGQNRLYLAEGVAAVIEVKSNLASQWNDVVKTANSLATLHRKIGASMIMGGDFPGPRIPLYAVGYKGWSSVETLEKHVNDQPNIDGALIIDPGHYYSKTLNAQGTLSLWALICDLHRKTVSLQAAAPSPLIYAQTTDRE